MASKYLTTLLPCLLAIGCLYAQNPNSAVYPGRAATDSDLLVASNGSQTTLNGNINSAVTTLVLTSAAKFTAPLAITIESEMLVCTTLTVNTLSGCTRGWQGTSATSHVDGVQVRGFMTAWHHNQVAAEIKSIESALVTGVPTPFPSPGTSITLTAPRGYAICTGTCTVSVPVPATGYEFCVLNDDNVATAITLSALGSSAMYESTARTSYGTAGTGTFTATAAAGNKLCIVGRDATHYLTLSFTGTWTAN